MNQGEAIQALRALAAENDVTVSRSKVKRVFVKFRDEAGYTDEQACAKLGEMFLADHSVFIVDQEQIGGAGVIEAEVFVRDDRTQWDDRLKAAGVPEEIVKANRAKWEADHPTGFLATKGRGPSAEAIKLDEAKRQVEAGRKRMKKLRGNRE